MLRDPDKDKEPPAATPRSSAGLSPYEGRQAAAGWVAQLGQRSRVVGTAGLRIVAVALGVINAFLLAKFAGAAEYGAFSLAVGIVTVLGTLAALGFDKIGILEVGRRVADDEHHYLPIFRRKMVAAVVVAGAGAGIAVLAIAVFGMHTGDKRRDPLAVGALSIPLFALMLALQGYAQGYNAVLRSRLPEDVLRPLILLVGLAIVLVSGASLTGASASAIQLAAIALALAVLGKWILDLETHGLTTGASRVLLPWRTIFIFSLISGVTLLLTYIDTIAVGILEGAYSAGVYSAAWRIAVLVSLATVSVNAVVAPLIVRRYAAGDMPGLQRELTPILRFGAVGASVIAVILALFATPLLEMVGHEYVAGVTALRILICGFFVSALAGCNGMLLMMSGNEREALYGLGASIAVLLVLLGVLIPTLGITGAAIASASASVTWNVVLTRLCHLRVGVDPGVLGARAFRGRRERRGDEKG